MRVIDFMKTDVITLTSSTSIFEALKLFKEHGIRRMPVIDNEKLVGIITRKALKEASPSTATSLSVYELNYLLSKMTVKDIMVKDVVTVTPETPFEEAGYIMHHQRLGGLPVMEGEKMVGYISSNDLFDVMVRVEGLDIPASRVVIEIDADMWHQAINDCVDVVDEDHDEFKTIALLDIAPGKKYLITRFRITGKKNTFVSEMQKKGYKIISVFEKVKAV
ncbi:MAG: CBS domain-containing protein [Deltaproteobacteria bacterium]|nr:CBS domain-containing protein [Deltaproteobacteria bacterium]